MFRLACTFARGFCKKGPGNEGQDRDEIKSRVSRAFRGSVMLTLWGFSWIVPSSAATNQIQFNRDIRPLLADRCFKCHGPDQGSRKAKLRLDRAEDAYAQRPDKSHAIVPSHPELSLVCQHILDA